MTERSHRHLVRGLQTLDPVEVRGEKYGGVYLSRIVSIDPSQPQAESARTPQLISELGVLAAAASKDKQIVEANYRVWRDTQILNVVTDADAAESEGLTDGKKTASKTTADIWVRTLDEYIVWQEKIAAADEAWAAIYETLVAAKSREKALFEFARSGVADQPDTAPRVEYTTPELPRIGYDELPAAQKEVASQERTALPPPLPTNAGPPPMPVPISNPPSRLPPPKR